MQKRGSERPYHELVISWGNPWKFGVTPIADRLIEFPIAITGLAWIWLGRIIHQKQLL